ncbi:hypothetical protein [uncultured Draconibacterium sp.]|uniref:hypothetical protein n=1 Tax=uncultured Draconibacterium sp. TaxID=1573823 RepID=UPI002AA76B96|nr:hypothetical protein [uncultured Draconibacterium sp.]
MGSRTNYYYLILELLRLKDEFHRIRSPKLKPLIGLLKTKFIVWEDGCEIIPSNKDIAFELGYKIARTNNMLKQLFNKLHEDFYFNPLKITNIVHKVIIMYDRDEEERLKQSRYEIEYKSMFFDLQLKETPRFGEVIEFEVVPAGIINRGIVHEIRHKIEGKTQIVEIICHPLRNAYENWVRMKERYEDHQRWQKFQKYKNRDR